VVREAELEQTDAGLVPASAGWFVMNARDARWFHRPFQASGPWSFHTVDEAARRHNACSDEKTQDGDVAYARVPPSHPVRYRDGLLPNL
jgi:hypothetical protein